ncbi:PH domain-containing protein [Corynebacterium cystitidis]|uniref:PH domain-containing protein n=1 Tax=Corynebacterium cystitidis TaxID=35757 RepID=UPI00211E3E34|nr:PH domain-containing protein [Corynebacterium cystitidis]
MTDREIAIMNAADPFAATTDKPWECEATSSFLRKVAIVWVIIVMVIHIFMGVVVDIEYTGAAITPIDKWAYPLIGVIISILSWIALNRPRVRANVDGVEVRNMIGTRFYSWVVIYGLSFPQGARMARLELPEFEYVPLWAIQSADGEKALEYVRDFRKLESKYMPED